MWVLLSVTGVVLGLRLLGQWLAGRMPAEGE